VGLGNLNYKMDWILCVPWCFYTLQWSPDVELVITMIVTLLVS